MIKFNDNIDIIEDDTPLEDNEYYALMVTDELNKNKRNPREYFDHKKAWLGLEQTGEREHEIYISKSINKRTERNRGVTLKVAVKNIEKCFILSQEEKKRV